VVLALQSFGGWNLSEPRAFPVAQEGAVSSQTEPKEDAMTKPQLRPKYKMIAGGQNIWGAPRRAPSTAGIRPANTAQRRKGKLPISACSAPPSRAEGLLRPTISERPSSTAIYVEAGA